MTRRLEEVAGSYASANELGHLDGKDRLSRGGRLGRQVLWNHSSVVDSLFPA